MPLYSIKGPDGNTYQIEGPEGATREQIIDAIQYKLGRQAKPAVKPETTFGGNVKEFFKGLAPGAVGLVESAAVGASALLPKDTEESARKRIAEIAGAAKAPFAAAPGYEDTIGRKFGEAAGSIAPFLALGPAGIAGRAGMAALGTGAGAGEARTRAEQEGATAEQRGTATALGSVVGISEMFAPLRILGRLDDPIKRGATAQLKRIAAAGGEEAAQEAAAQIAQNLIAKGIYKPEQAIIEQVGESAAYGGAVGALAQGLLDMALGRRVKGAGAGTPDEIAQARAEADAAAAAEQERKASPEYAQQFVADYETRRQQFIDAKAALQRPSKDATPDVWQAYKEQRDAVTALNDDLKKDAKEYNQLAPKLKEAARRAALQPEDVLLDQLGMKVAPAAPPKTRMVVDEFGQVTDVPEGQEQAEPIAAPQQYLTQQVEAARGFGQLSLGDYADFAMQDPQMAAEVVKARVKLPMLTSAENNALLSGINLRLKDLEKQRAAQTKALYEQRSADLKAQQPTPEITNELAGIEQYLAEIAERGPAQVEPTFEYLDPIFEQAFNQPPTIKISDKVQPIKNAPAIRERIESLMQQADQADKDYSTARAARQPDAAVAAKSRASAAVQEIESLSKEGNEYSKEFLAARKGQTEALASLQDIAEQLRTGQTLGGRNKEMAASTEQTLTNKAEKLRAQLITNALQEAALHRRAAGESAITQTAAIKAASKLYDEVNALLERAKAKPEQIEYEEVVVQPAQMRGAEIAKPAVTERRRVQPKAAELSEQAVAKKAEERAAAEQLQRVEQQIKEVKSNIAGLREERAASKSQDALARLDAQLAKEQNKLGPLSLQETEARDELERITSATEPTEQAPTVFGEFEKQVDAVRRQLFEPPKGQAVRVEPVLKTQFAETEAAKVAEARGETADTLGGGLRRRTEFVRNKMAKMGGMRPMARDVLNKAADVMDAGRASQALLDAVEPVVDAITSKRQITQTDLRAINDALKAATPTAAEQQAQGQQALNLLFEEPGQRPRLVQKDLGFIRNSFKNFENAPVIKKARLAVEQVKKLAKQLEAKRAQEEKNRAAAAEKVAKAQQRRILDLEGTVRQQRNDLQQAVYDAIEAEKIALADAKKLAAAPQIKAAEQSLADAEKMLKDLEQRLEVLTENIQFPWMDSVKKEKARVRGRIGYQQTVVQNAKNELAQALANSQVQYEHAALVAKANQDSMVQFERKALEKFEQRLEKLRAQVQAPSADVAAAQKAADEQRARVAVAEANARKAAEQANRDQRELEQRFLSGLGLPGVKRVAGETVEIETAERKQLRKEIDEAKQRFDEAQDAVEGVKVEAEQVPKATGPVMRGVRTKVRKLTQERTPKQPEVETAVAEANVMAAERAAQEPEKTPVETAKEAAQRQQQMREAKERLENTIRRQLADLNIRIEALERAEINKPNPDRIRELKEDRAALQRQLVAARQDIEKEGELEKKTQRELNKVQRAQAKREAEDELLSPARVNYQLAYDGVMWQDLPPKDATKAQVLKQLSQDFEAYGKAPGPKNLATVVAALREKYARMVVSSSQPEKFREYLRELNALDMSRVEAPQAPRTAAPVAKRPTARPISSRFLNDTPEQTAEALATRYKAQGVADDAEYNGMTFAEAARYGARKTTSPMVRALFERLAEVFDTAPAARGGQGRVYALNGTLTAGQRAARGVFSHTDNTVVVSHGRTNTNKTLLHELMHAATFYGLDVNKELDQRVTELRNRVKDWLKTPEGRAYFRQKRMELQAQKPEEIYGLTDNDEFLAELYSDRGFQKLLTQVPSSMPRKNVFTRFIELLSKFFDMPSQAAQSAFADAVALSEEVLQTTVDQVYGSPTPIPTSTRGPLLSIEPTYASPEMEAAAKKLDPFVAKQRSVNERVRAASGGFLGLETMLVDRFAGFERLSKYLPEHLGTQMMYYLRMYDMRMNLVAQAVANGAPQIVEKTRKDGKTERLIEAKEGPSIKRTVEILREANPMVGNAEAVNRLFTAYMAGIRADNKGFDSLNFGEGVTPEMLKDALSVVNGNPALKKIFDNARSEYNAYNRNLVEFLVETGAISRDVANRLMAENDYIPFYRERGGAVELLIGKESPIRIGSIKEQPYLQQLVGGDQPILDFLTSSVQNTNFLVDMGMGNLATKNAIYELVDLSAAKIVGGKPTGTNVVKFKDKGVDKYAVLATEKVKIGNKEFETGVPADILVKGMEGVPTQMPVLLRAFALPAQLLRKGVTLSPLYIARQLFRDSLAAPILAGANFMPVLGALRQIGTPTKDVLERRGITGGQQFTGTSDDLSMILRDVADGKPGWMSLLAKAEGVAMSADALTRRAQYNSYVEQGLSEMEATLMSLESMNFSKRGASPSIQIANSMIPFFNAQIQGLNVMYKALTGKMPLNDKLKLREKLLQRGGMMAAASMVYAIMMQEDEAYQNAEADQKYANWFVRIPGVDEPVRIPIPFEIGYIFKALPEAIVNSMASEEGGEQALKALKQIIIQTIPGGSSMPQIGGVPLPLPIPQALKPAIEAGLGKSFYTGRDILSGREKDLLPEDQFRANTAEISKLIGQQAGVSPIILESLVRGYTGTMGLALLHTLSLGVPPGEGPEKAVKRLSEYPVIGGAFQPNDAGAIINSVYERMNNAQKVGRTYEKMVTEGRAAEANSLLQRRGNEVLQAELGDEFKSNMNQIVAAERAIQASNMSGEEKRKQLDELRKLKIAVAKEIRDVADKTVKLSFSL